MAAVVGFGAGSWSDRVDDPAVFSTTDGTSTDPWAFVCEPLVELTEGSLASARGLGDLGKLQRLPILGAGLAGRVAALLAGGLRAFLGTAGPWSDDEAEDGATGNGFFSSR